MLPFGARALAAPTNHRSGVVATADTASPDTTIYVIKQDPALCINSNPRPDCGFKPTQPGDPGGWMQYTAFAIMIGALSIIGTVVVRNVMKRDRAIAEALRQAEENSSK
jgi:hypothetical protein